MSFAQQSKPCYSLGNRILLPSSTCSVVLLHCLFSNSHSVSLSSVHWSISMQTAWNVCSDSIGQQQVSEKVSASKKGSERKALFFRVLEVADKPSYFQFHLARIINQEAVVLLCWNVHLEPCTPSKCLDYCFCSIQIKKGFSWCFHLRTTTVLILEKKLSIFLLRHTDVLR